jgi:glutathione peroxidase
MKSAGRTGIAAILVVTAVAIAQAKDPKSVDSKAGKKSDAGKPEGTVLQFKMKDIDGNDVDLSKYAGNVLLIVNTASKCGFTPQYKSLQELYEKYQSKGFYVLGFPCNDFGAQEPGSESQIKKFCTEKYAVTFPLFAKVKVKGKDACDLYKFLTSEKTDPRFAGEIPWNFTKFLIDRDGKVIGRFKHSDDPLKNKKLIEALEKALAPKPPAESPKG